METDKMPIKKIDKHKKNFGVKNSNAVKLQDMKTNREIDNAIAIKIKLLSFILDMYLFEEPLIKAMDLKSINKFIKLNAKTILGVV